MNESPESTSESSLQEQVTTLRHQLNSTLMLVTGIAVIITWFFAYQSYYGWTDSNRARAAAQETQRAIEEFNRVNEPQFQEIMRRLRDYSKTHPDLLPILNKYGVMPATNAPAAPAKK